MCAIEEGDLLLIEDVNSPVDKSLANIFLICLLFYCHLWGLEVEICYESTNGKKKGNKEKGRKGERKKTKKKGRRKEWKKEYIIKKDKTQRQKVDRAI